MKGIAFAWKRVGSGHGSDVCESGRIRVKKWPVSISGCNYYNCCIWNQL